MLVSFCLTIAIAGPYDAPYHPYRKVGDRYYSLQPIYEWQKLLSIPGNKLTPKQRASSRPMQEWIGERRDLETPIDVTYRVASVAAEGLIITAESHGYRSGTLAYRTLLLLNYPLQKKVADGQAINFLALKTGVREVAGWGTLEVYDYGIPYDPQALAAEKARTNILTNTNAITAPLRTNHPSKK